MSRGRRSRGRGGAVSLFQRPGAHRLPEPFRAPLWPAYAALTVAALLVVVSVR